MKNDITMVTFIQAMNVIIGFYESYKTVYTEDGEARSTKAAQFANLVNRCTNWAVRAGLLVKEPAKEMSTMEVHNQYLKLVDIYKKIA